MSNVASSDLQGFRVKSPAVKIDPAIGTVTTLPHMIENTGEWFAFVTNDDGTGYHVKAGSEKALVAKIVAMKV